MRVTTTTTSTKAIVFTRGFLLGIVALFISSTATWASTRLGQDIEVQAWYCTRTTSQTDGKEHCDWVQWPRPPLTMEDFARPASAAWDNWGAE